MGFMPLLCLHMLVFVQIMEISIRSALIEGEMSGDPEPFDFAEFKRRKLEEHG